MRCKFLAKGHECWLSWNLRFAPSLATAPFCCNPGSFGPDRHVRPPKISCLWNKGPGIWFPRWVGQAAKLRFSSAADSRVVFDYGAAAEKALRRKVRLV